METAQDGAVCARHAGAVAVGVCERCGNFMCAECVASGTPSRCTQCEEKQRFVPLGVRAPLAQHVSAAWKAFTAYPGAIIGALVIWLVVSAASGLVANVLASAVNRALDTIGPDDAKVIDLPRLLASVGVSAAIDWFINALSDGVVMVGACRLLLDALQGRAPSFSVMFDFSRARRGVALTLSLLVLKLLVDGSVFVVFAIATQGQRFTLGDGEALRRAVNGSNVALMLVGVNVLQIVYFALLPLQYFAVPQFALYDTPVRETLATAWRIARGHRLRIVGWWFVSLVACVVSVAACCVGAVVVVPLVLLVWLSLFLSLRHGFGGETSPTK